MCAECPQAQANQGREHPDDWYSRGAVAGLWRAVRHGDPVSCHVTEADRNVYRVTEEQAAAGFVVPPEQAQRRECSGVAVALRRELTRLDDAGSFEEYSRRWPAGLTRDALAIAAARVRGAHRPELRATDVEETAVVDIPTWGLSPREYLTDRELNGLGDVLGRLLGGSRA
ncbi:hypothetical protein SAMN05661080_05177 [Modestobacter sp. DSM 44400]|nr:hypothetical protein SAMN05661080_05177 [Modestobacter sp. DSM 44400]